MPRDKLVKWSFSHGFFVYRYIHVFYFLLIAFCYFTLLKGTLYFFEIYQTINMKLYELFHMLF